MGWLTGSSSSGNKGAQQVNVPPFLSPGGVTGPQTDLAGYNMGQGDIAQANLFGGSGTGMSTMATQGAGGVAFKGAEELGQASDINQEAAYTDYTNQVQSELTQLAQNTATNQANLSAEASSLGKLFTSGTSTTTPSTVTS